MPQLIRKPIETQIVSKEGEVKLNISLDITVNINSNGEVTAGVESVEPKMEDLRGKTDKTNWIIPDFKPKEKLKFGLSKE